MKAGKGATARRISVLRRRWELYQKKHFHNILLNLCLRRSIFSKPQHEASNTKNSRMYKYKITWEGNENIFVHAEYLVIS